jgi:hypothetical protein
VPRGFPAICEQPPSRMRFNPQAAQTSPSGQALTTVANAARCLQRVIER